jgi:hypothetical protein
LADLNSASGSGVYEYYSMRMPDGVLNTPYIPIYNPDYCCLAGCSPRRYGVARKGTPSSDLAPSWHIISKHRKPARHERIGVKSLGYCPSFVCRVVFRSGGIQPLLDLEEVMLLFLSLEYSFHFTSDRRIIPRRLGGSQSVAFTSTLDPNTSRHCHTYDPCLCQTCESVFPDPNVPLYPFHYARSAPPGHAGRELGSCVDVAWNSPSFF